MKVKTDDVIENDLVYKHKLRTGEVRNLWVSRILIWFFVLFALFPIFSVISASLTKGDTFFSTTLWPKSITFSNYTKVLQETDFKIWMKNSLILCTSVALIQLVISIFAAYAFSRMKFKGRKNGLMGLLILQMFPAVMFMPAILSVCFKIGLLDQFWALIILLAAGSAYNIWLLKGFIDSLPKELDEAAMVDGASHFQVFTKIILPLSKPMLAVIFLFSFIGVYSEFIYTSALMRDADNQTLATGLQQFINNAFSAHWTQFSAAAVMATIPVAILFMASQRFISKGLTAGAVKG
ncbi:sugar ABC transporter permease [Clostridium akagii]|uniref:sugar ABC transporter permease n=1 Tax=Clostridium akagii TaxID=91623 RepID=UPI00055EF91F|nr:sugar ABC transporter permease [Clostridium akagii]